MNKDQAFIQKWLTRLRKDLANSGRLTELSLHLTKSSQHTPEHWQTQLRLILEEQTKPTTDLILAIDRWITTKPKPKPPTTENQQDLF